MKRKGHVEKSRRREQGPKSIKHVYCARNIKVKKSTMTFIPTYLYKAEDKKKKILVEPSVNGPETVAAIYKMENNERVAVFNTHERKGSMLREYAEIQPIEFEPSSETIIY